MDYLAIREGDLFQVAGPDGDMVPGQPAGLFYRDTRHLSHLELFLAGQRPAVLAATAHANYALRIYAQAGVQDTLHHQTHVGIQRCRVIHAGVLYERIAITHYRQTPVQTRLELRFGADFGDLFEVRGARRTARGDHLPPAVHDSAVRLAYRGLDGVERHTELHFAAGGHARLAALAPDRAVWDLDLPPGGWAVVDVAVIPGQGGHRPSPAGFDQALAALQASYAAWQEGLPALVAESDLLSRILQRSVLDLRLLLADLGHGPFPVAGIPWFAVPFGRDSILTALLALPLCPDLARGTLRTLAALQGREVNAFRQEEPGKILHELRQGEMANLGEVPFGRYYGSVDSTPLFLVLLCDYVAWTGDLELVRELLPAVRAALDWLHTYGDPDGDGYIEYRSHDGTGLVVQSWKDSHDSMCHRDGRPAQGPVAVSEVQGYAYDAQRRLAPILAALGQADLARELAARAAALRAQFNRDFWMADRQYIAIALDGAKAQVGTVASDAGHCLWSGIVDPERARAVAARLLAPDLFSGWGIRTLSSAEVTYNPMSYHNGSVWPHDNALCALGLKRYGFDREAAQVATALFEAAAHFPGYRLPELFCGFDRQEGPPVPYPVACAPQAWAAAAPIGLVQALLGLEPDALAGTLHLRPHLPPRLGHLAVRGLRVGQAVVDIEAGPGGTRVEVRQGHLQVTGQG